MLVALRAKEAQAAAAAPVAVAVAEEVAVGGVGGVLVEVVTEVLEVGSVMAGADARGSPT